ncbi:hypothetical protein PACTADRAFT_185118 [Pachysolen tannophilus NRRL Y-2460]|uniref:Tetrapyrrole biosynthesis uroporphyrinogen III synthase domain-containing protein n=1 Tax=Pachysolen tannophilus NRRL Y-2460 TaxID=669874 RepID=A0A1E4U300_PACTA|nr:hypothetical protein PACTADRAFT_185118 [Pachysolen tannophilus NRRL Y-2460]
MPSNSVSHVLLLKNPTTPVDPYEEQFGNDQDYEPHFIPLLRHTHLNKEELVNYLISDEFLYMTSSLIVTSHRAVEVLIECVGSLTNHIIKDLIFQKPAYTVGPTTSRFLANAGFIDIRGGSDAGNGSILSDIIIKDDLDKNLKICFFTGEIRKDIIPKRLRMENFDLIERIIYKTEPMDDIIERFHKELDKVDQNNGNVNHWIVFYSPQGTENIVKYIGNNFWENLKIASIGPTTEEYLIKNGIVPSAVARKPDALSLFQSIKEFNN